MANSILHSQVPPIYGAAFTVCTGFRATSGISLAPTGIDTEISMDAGTFADATNEVTLIKEVGGSTDSALGFITFTDTEMTASNVTIQIKSGNCVTEQITIAPQRILSVTTGTATAATSGSLTLAVGSVAVNDYYSGMVLRTDSGTGSGQARWVYDFDGSTLIATVIPAFEVTPASGTTYTIGLLPGSIASVGAMATDVISAGSISSAAVTKIQNGLAIESGGNISSILSKTDVATSTRMSSADLLSVAQEITLTGGIATILTAISTESSGTTACLLPIYVKDDLGVGIEGAFVQYWEDEAMTIGGWGLYTNEDGYVEFPGIQGEAAWFEISASGHTFSNPYYGVFSPS